MFQEIGDDRVHTEFRSEEGSSLDGRMLPTRPIFDRRGPEVPDNQILVVVEALARNLHGHTE